MPKDNDLSYVFQNTNNKSAKNNNLYVNKDDIKKFIDFIITTDFEDNDNLDETMKDLNKQILNLYDGEKRHLYSDISSEIYELYKKTKTMNDINTLEFKIKYIIYNCSSFLNVENKNFFKFSDHVLLECTRTATYFTIFVESQTLESEISKLTKELDDKNKEFKKTNEEFKETSDEFKKTSENLEHKHTKIEDSLKNNMVSSITIFTIFSAIILVFSGSLTISTGFIEALDNNILDLLILLSILGFIFTNTVFMLFYLVNKMSFKDTNLSIDCGFTDDKPTDKNMSIKCGNKYCNKRKKWTLFKIYCVSHRKYPFIFYMNIILLIILSISSVLTYVYKFNPDLFS